MVTTPSRAAGAVVARALTCARDAHAARVGIVRNMDGVVCAACGNVTPLFGTRADEVDARTWARLPFDPAAAEATDLGQPLPADSPLDTAIAGLADRVCREIALQPLAQP